LDKANLLDPDIYPDERFGFILDKMKEIGLCFEIRGAEDDRYLIREALPKRVPDYEFAFGEALRFRYRYDFIPPGLIPRFIVEAIGCSPTAHTMAYGLSSELPRLPYFGKGRPRVRSIDIAVTGKADSQRRSALSVVLSHLDAVHEQNPEIGARARVPLPDQPDFDISYDHLLDLETKEGLEYAYRPEDAGRSYTVGELLEGVRRETIVHLEDDRSSVSIGLPDVRGKRRPVAGPVHRSKEQDRPDGSVPAVFSSWPYFSLTCGLASALFVLILWRIPADYRLPLAGAAAVGVLVMTFVLGRNPANFYRRILASLVASGIALNAVGFSLKAFGSSVTWLAGVHLDTETSNSFNIGWVVVAVALIFADLYSRRKS
jgi:hypothetical protein